MRRVMTSQKAFPTRHGPLLDNFSFSNGSSIQLGVPKDNFQILWIYPSKWKISPSGKCFGLYLVLHSVGSNRNKWISWVILQKSHNKKQVPKSRKIHLDATKRKKDWTKSFAACQNCSVEKNFLFPFLWKFFGSSSWSFWHALQDKQQSCLNVLMLCWYVLESLCGLKEFFHVFPPILIPNFEVNLFIPSLALFLISLSESKKEWTFACVNKMLATI